MLNLLVILLPVLWNARGAAMVMRERHWPLIAWVPLALGMLLLAPHHESFGPDVGQMIGGVMMVFGAVLVLFDLLLLMIGLTTRRGIRVALGILGFIPLTLVTFLMFQMGQQAVARQHDEALGAIFQQ